MSAEVNYAARTRFGPGADNGWERYVTWSKLYHLREVVSLDSMLNGSAFEYDFASPEATSCMVDVNGHFFGLYSSLPYVLARVDQEQTFNLLAVVHDPEETRPHLHSEFAFVGYDLLDRAGDVSALVNCGGFDESFLPGDLNEWGLIEDWHRAREVQRDLLANNPNEFHADCELYEVWRHEGFGRI